MRGSRWHGGDGGDGGGGAGGGAGNASGDEYAWRGAGGDGAWRTRTVTEPGGTNIYEGDGGGRKRAEAVAAAAA